MHIHFIIHESYEGPAAFEEWVVKKGFKQSSTHLYKGDKLPSVLNFDLLVVLGGPQNPNTTLAECPHFNAEQEISFIKQAIATNKAVVGVCLGAQLIGESFGASVENSPQQEIGFFPINMTQQGQKADIFNHFQSTEIVGHWHNDMPGVLPTSKILAYSDVCPRQIIEYSNLVYGFQCHLEFTKESIAELIKHAYEPDQAKTQPWVQTSAELLTMNTGHMNVLLFQFLDGLILKLR